MVNSFRLGKHFLGFLCCFLGLTTSTLKAQRDSIALEEVKITTTAPLHYMAGSYVQTLDSITLGSLAFSRLDELLTLNTSLSFRNYGNGQLSTVSFRGLSSNHTAVLWNGVNINMPTLGQTDFSTVPSAAFDRLSIQHGAGSANLGSDAVGGSIVMESVPLGEEGFGVRAGADYGSFGNWSAQTAVRYRSRLGSRWIFSGKTQLSKINYPNRYGSTTFKGRRLEHSTTFQNALIQDVFLENGKGEVISAHLWLNDHQMTLSPEKISGRQLTGMTNARAMIRYTGSKWRFRGSFLRDIIDYGTGDYTAMDRSVVDRYGVKAEREFRWQFENTSLEVLTGGEYTFFKAEVNGYEARSVQEGRGDIFAFGRLSHLSGWTVSASLRQAFVQGYTVPFTPSLGFEYAFLKRAGYTLKATTSLARSYRVPTLNERYWKDLGNPDIIPESGFSKEVGLEQKIRFFENFALKTRFNVFHNKVDNWVYWNPARSFRAENLQLVKSRGIELHNEISMSFGAWSAGLQSLIGYTRSSQERSYDVYSSSLLGQQLRFVPVWLSNFNAYVRFNSTTLRLQRHYESLRYINQIQSLPAYSVVNFFVEQEVRIGTAVSRLQGRVMNAADQLYLNVKSTAMPGRSFHISLLFDYQLIKSKP